MSHLLAKPAAPPVSGILSAGSALELSTRAVSGILARVRLFRDQEMQAQVRTWGNFIEGASSAHKGRSVHSPTEALGGEAADGDRVEVNVTCAP
jgi:hypothetical protein